MVCLSSIWALMGIAARIDSTTVQRQLEFRDNRLFIWRMHRHVNPDENEGA